MAKETVIPIDTCILKMEQVIEDLEYRLKRAKSPQSKRGIAASLEWWQSIKHHLINNKAQA